MSIEHLVFGADLVGSYLAAALQASGQSVSLIARSSAQARFARGLRVTDYQGKDYHARGLEFATPYFSARPLDSPGISVARCSVSAPGAILVDHRPQCTVFHVGRFVFGA